MEKKEQTPKINNRFLETKGVRIYKRFGICPCGCGGKDKNHRRYYTRTVRDLRIESGTAKTLTGSVVEYDARGTVRAPWSNQPVPVVRTVNTFLDGSLHASFWEFVEA